jgi:hypothetical protein
MPLGDSAQQPTPSTLHSTPPTKHSTPCRDAGQLQQALLQQQRVVHQELADGQQLQPAQQHSSPSGSSDDYDFAGAIAAFEAAQQEGFVKQCTPQQSHGVECGARIAATPLAHSGCASPAAPLQPPSSRATDADLASLEAEIEAANEADLKE